MLDQRLRDATDGVKAALAELVPPPIEDLAGSSRKESPRLAGASVPWRGPLIAVGTAVAIFVVVAASMLLIRIDRFDVVDEPAPMILTTPTTVPATDPPPQAASPVTWSRVEDPDIGRGFDTSLPGDPRFGGSILALASTDHGWMVGGRSDNDAAVWISTDASDWARIADAQDAFGAADSPYGGDGWREIAGFASFEGRTVAVGVEDLNRNFAGESERRIAAVWYTDDGGSWHRVEHDPDVFGVFSHNDMRAVTATSSGFVAVGSDAWTSPDGIRWDRHELHPGSAFTIIATEEGLIAAGSTAGFNDKWDGGRSAVWTSVDGVTWHPAVVETTPSPDVSWIEAIAPTETGFVAVGSGGPLGDPAMWISEDGATWDLSWIGDVEYVWGVLSGVVADGDRLVAVGTDYSSQASPFYGGTVWWSQDAGESWMRDPDPQLIFGHPHSEFRGGTLTAIAKTGDGFLTVGTLAEEPTIWKGNW